MLIRIPYGFLILLLILLTGCGKSLKTFIPDARVSSDKYTEKTPIEVFLLVNSDFENYIFKRDIYRPTSKMTFSLKIDIGASSRELFKQGLGEVFEKVTIIYPEDKSSIDALVFIPDIRHVDAHPGTTVDSPQTTIEYDVTVMTSANREVERIRGSGHGSFHTTGYTLGSTVVNILTLNMTRGTDVNYEYSKAFANAEVAAFENLMRNLKKSPTFATYVAVAIENQRRNK